MDLIINASIRRASFGYEDAREKSSHDGTNIIATDLTRLSVIYPH